MHAPGMRSHCQRAPQAQWGSHKALPCRPRALVVPSSSGGAGTPAAGAAGAAAPPAAPALDDQRDAAAAKGRQLVDRVLEDVRGSDGGLALPEDARARVDAALDELERIGAQQRPRPLDNPLLWGNYEVAYTSIARATEAQRRGQPAGGRFRGRVGRALFQTAGVFQSVLRPDVATNKVAFKMFGVLPGYVGLRGRIQPVGDDGDTVKVFFDRPVLSFGGCLHLRIGPPSSVQLATTYLDGRVRLGKGSRGSLFVFERTPSADAAAMDLVGLERTTPAGAALLAAALGALAFGGWSLFSTGAPALQVAGAGLWLITVGLALVFRQGGVIEDDKEPEGQQQQQQQQQPQEQQQPPVAPA